MFFYSFKRNTKSTPNDKLTDCDFIINKKNNITELRQRVVNLYYKIQIYRS
jgi:hypothetical protein